MPESNLKIIKIAFVGTSCVGKSSLLQSCNQQLPYPVIPVAEAARQYFTDHPEITNRFGVVTQGAVQDLALSNEHRAHKQALRIGSSVSIVCDRSVLDAPVYVSSTGDEPGATSLIEKVSHWLPSYDKLYLLDPTDVPYQTDSIRRESEATRQLFHVAFINFFAEYAISYELLSGTNEQRLDQVQSFITPIID